MIVHLRGARFYKMKIRLTNMTKITTEQKISLLDAYIDAPPPDDDLPIFRAIKADVLKLNTKGVKKASEADNKLYNDCMGEYRKFLKDRGTVLDMSTAKKRGMTSRAMKDLIAYIRNYQKANGGNPYDDKTVLMGIQYIFNHWNKLSPFHQNRILLPDIYAKIEEIILQLKKGHDKKSSANSAIERRQQELAAKRHQGRN